LLDAVLEQRIWMAQGRNTDLHELHAYGSSEAVDFELNPRVQLS